MTLSLPATLKRGYGRVEVGLFSHIISDRTRGNVLRLRQGRFRLDVMKKFFSKTVLRCWNGLPMDMVQSPSLEMLKKRVDVTLRDVVSGHGGDGLMVGHGDPSSLFQP